MVSNSTDEDGDSLFYEFELFADADYTDVIAAVMVSEGVDQTSWTVSDAISDNAGYTWRVRATDGYSFSQWAYGRFFVSTKNDPPGPLEIRYPEHESTVSTTKPTLSVINSVDPDGDAIVYDVAVYTDPTMVQPPVASAADIAEGDNGFTAWTVDFDLEDGVTYYWQVKARDPAGEAVKTEPVSFDVNTSTLIPAAPQILSPATGDSVTAYAADLNVQNTVTPGAWSYLFEIDTKETFDSPDLQASEPVTEGAETTTWTVSDLFEDTRYFWRVRAQGGGAFSDWADGEFFVSTINDPPAVPVLKNPGEDAWVTSLRPTLAVYPSADPEGDPVEYRFAVYADSDLNELVATSEAGTTTPAWAVPDPLTVRTWYYWTVQAVDAGGAESLPMPAAAFFVDDDGIDDPPEFTFITPSVPVVTNGGTFSVSWVDNDPDSNAIIALYHDTDNAGMDGTLIKDGITEDDPDDTFEWDISGLDDGTYYIYALIRDDLTPIEARAPGSITVDRTPPTPQAQPEGGIHPTGTQIILSTEEDASIYYTLDGSEPTTDSTLYGGPLSLTQNMVLRVLAVDAAGNASSILDQTYEVNDPPTISGDSIQIVNEDTPYDFTPVVDDPNVGDSLVFSFENMPAWITFDDGSGTLSGTPTNDEVGTFAGIKITVTDKAGASDTLDFTLEVKNVNDAPSAAPENYSLNEDSLLTVAAPGVLGNDEDVDNTELSVVLTEDTTHGSLTLSANEGSFTYQPETNYNGSDSFTYKVSDGKLFSDTVTVTLEIRPVNDAPQMAITSPAGPVVTNENEIEVWWTDEDVDSNAAVAVYYRAQPQGELIAIGENLSEDPDGDADSLTWNVSAIEGTFDLSAVIDDGEFSPSAPGNGSLVIDHTPPEINSTISPAANDAGWHNTDVTVSYAVTDALAGVDPNLGDVTDDIFSVEGADLVAEAEAFDTAGNRAFFSLPVKIDKTPPTLTTELDPLPNQSGWHSTDVRVRVFAEDDLSGIAQFSADSLWGEDTPAQTVDVIATDAAGNLATASVELHIDKTAPTIQVASRTPANANGWNNTDVTVSYIATDALSGVDPSLGDITDDLFSSESDVLTAEAEAFDMAGNRADFSLPIKIDKTMPTLTPVVDP